MILGQSKKIFQEEEPTKKEQHPTVTFQDLSANAFKVTISRVQQEALRRVNCTVPNPNQQLALIAERRQKKTKAKANPILINIFLFSLLFILVGCIWYFLSLSSRSASLTKEPWSSRKCHSAGLDCGVSQAGQWQSRRSDLQVLHPEEGWETILVSETRFM